MRCGNKMGVWTQGDKKQRRKKQAKTRKIRKKKCNTHRDQKKGGEPHRDRKTREKTDQETSEIFQLLQEKQPLTCDLKG